MRQELLRRQIFTPTSGESPLAEHGSRGTPGREWRFQQEQRRWGLLPVRRRLQVSRAPGNGSQNRLRALSKITILRTLLLMFFATHYEEHIKIVEIPSGSDASFA